jgi:hypothetical protein
MKPTTLTLALALLWASPAAAQEVSIEQAGAMTMIGGAYCIGATSDLTWTEHDVDALIEGVVKKVEEQGGSFLVLKAAVARAQKVLTTNPPGPNECEQLLSIVRQIIGKE